MLIRSLNGKLVEININDYLNDIEYYKEIFKLKEKK